MSYDEDVTPVDQDAKVEAQLTLTNEEAALRWRCLELARAWYEHDDDGDLVRTADALFQYIWHGKVPPEEE